MCAHTVYLVRCAVFTYRKVGSVFCVHLPDWVLYPRGNSKLVALWLGLELLVLLILTETLITTTTQLLTLILPLSSSLP